MAEVTAKIEHQTYQGTRSAREPAKDDDADMEAVVAAMVPLFD